VWRPRAEDKLGGLCITRNACRVADDKSPDDTNGIVGLNYCSVLSEYDDM